VLIRQHHAQQWAPHTMKIMTNLLTKNISEHGVFKILKTTQRNCIVPDREGISSEWISSSMPVIIVTHTVHSNIYRQT